MYGLIRQPPRRCLRTTEWAVCFALVGVGAVYGTASYYVIIDNLGKEMVDAASYFWGYFVMCSMSVFRSLTPPSS